MLKKEEVLIHVIKEKVRVANAVHNSGIFLGIKQAETLVKMIDRWLEEEQTE